MTRNRWIGMLVGLVLAIGGVLAVTPAANASIPGITACSGFSCDGLDPTLSYHIDTDHFCNAGAYTVHAQPALGGTLELRWGPNCGTNWTRFTPTDNDTYEIWVTRLSDGVWAGDGLFVRHRFSGSNGIAHYSDQVYSPGPAQACVRDVDFNATVCYTQTA